MKKNDTLKKKKWLKARIRVNRMKRHHNFVAKTKQSAEVFRLEQYSDTIMEAEKKAVKKEIAKAMGLNPKDVR